MRGGERERDKLTCFWRKASTILVRQLCDQLGGHGTASKNEWKLNYQFVIIMAHRAAAAAHTTNDDDNNDATAAF